MPRMLIEYSVREVATRHTEIVLDVPDDKLRNGGATVDPRWVREQLDDLGIELEYDDCDILEERLGGHENASATEVDEGTPTTAEVQSGVVIMADDLLWVRIPPENVAFLRGECWGRGTDSCA